MMFSTRAEYGVRVMVALAHNEPDSPASLAQIAEQNALPFAYLEHLAARLKKAGLIESRRGPRGGYLLARDAQDISMANIVQALEGDIAPIECIASAGDDDSEIVCTRQGDADLPCPTKILWTRVRGSIVSTLTNMSLADLVAENERIAAFTASRRPADAAA
jgi:Rrf2 family protein